MSKVDAYRETLRNLADWEPYLLGESGLPGPRGNLELARAVAEEGNRELFHRLRALDAERAPLNTGQEFLAFCGVLGLGKLLVEGDREMFELLRLHASDSRWRIREAVAMALQWFGAGDMDALLQEMRRWAEGSLLEKRAAAAALCEPQLLSQKEQAERVLLILHDITASLQEAQDRKNEEFRVLRKGLAYCWSVAVAAHPEKGKGLMEQWFSSSDADILWLMRQNLGKKRLARMDAAWVKTWLDRLAT